MNNLFKDILINIYNKMSNKKRKLDYENRSFNSDWELKYFFIN